MDTVEGHHQIEAPVKRQLLRSDSLESDAAGHTRLGGFAKRSLDRRLVHIVAKESAMGIRRRNRYQALSSPTSHLRRFTSGDEPLMNIRYGWNPLLSDPGLVTRVEKPLDGFD